VLERESYCQAINTMPLRTSNSEAASTDDPSRQPTILKRWRQHILLVGLFEDTSRVLSNGRNAITPALVSTWFIVIFGVLIGGNGVNFVHWITIKLMNFSPMLDYVLLISVILAGPDFLPPLTPMNGSENLINRIVWSCLYFGHYWLTNSYYILGGGINGSSNSKLEEEDNEEKISGQSLMKLALSLSSFQLLSIISGIWHTDQGDYNYKRTQRDFHNYYRSRGRGINDNHLIDVSRYLMMYQFQAACGIGIFWATFEVYSKIVFLYVFIGFFLINVCVSVYGRLQGLY